MYRVSEKNGGVLMANLWKSGRLEALEQRNVLATGLWIKNAVLHVCVLVGVTFGVYLVHHP
jgi:hypothetical protein